MHMRGVRRRLGGVVAFCGHAAVQVLRDFMRHGPPLNGGLHMEHDGLLGATLARQYARVLHQAICERAICKEVLQLLWERLL
jgi:hypothetical protein